MCNSPEGEWGARAHLSRAESVCSVARSKLVHHTLALHRARLKRRGRPLIPSLFHVVHGSQDRVFRPRSVDNAAVDDFLREDRVGPVPKSQGAERQSALSGVRVQRGARAERGGNTCSIVARLSHLTTNHASLSRRSTVPTPNRHRQHLGAHCVFATNYIPVFFFLYYPLPASPFVVTIEHDNSPTSG